MSATRPKIVVLCGSSRFVDVMAVCAWLLERDENAVALSLHLLPWWYSADLPADHLAEHEGVAPRMDALHLEKIRLADEVFVVNCGGYVGSSTQNEIAFAQQLGKPIRWYRGDPIGAAVEQRIQAALERRQFTPSGGRTMTPSVCIGCGCDDNHACHGGTAAPPCWWLRVDAKQRVGVCSRCADLVEAFDRGERALQLEKIADRFYRQVLFLYESSRDAVTWVMTPQPGVLGRRSPRDMILEGKLAEVRAVVDQLQSGAYI